MLNSLPHTVYLYADASFNKEQNLGVLGFVMFTSTYEHDNVSASTLPVTIKKIAERNNIRAEIIGVMEALNACPIGSIITLYCDCQTVSNLLARREKLEAQGFISQTKQCLLANADLYKKFYLQIDKFKPQIIWVKGHSRAIGQSKIQQNFSYVDKEVRKELRKSTEVMSIIT